METKNTIGFNNMEVFCDSSGVFEVEARLELIEEWIENEWREAVVQRQRVKIFDYL